MIDPNPTPLPVPPLTLQEDFADLTLHTVLTQGAWAVWYNPDFFTQTQAQSTADLLTNARTLALNEVGMPDAQPLSSGHYVNVYLHEISSDSDPQQDQDGFDNEWGNGVGTNGFDQPFITFPGEAGQDAANAFHEGFHIFQYSANSLGFAYTGDTGWYIETTAEWFARSADADNERLYQTSGAIAGNPHLALWHGFENARPEDPVHWMTETRQYGLHAFLIHLEEDGMIAPADITDGFFAETELSPQAFLAGRIGKETMAHSWADFAARLTASFAMDTPLPDWIMSEEQRDHAREEREALIADNPIDGIVNDYAITLDLTDTSFSGTFAPPEALIPRPWAYNAIDLGTPEGALTIDLLSQQQKAFEMRLALLADGADQWVFEDVISGEASLLAEMSQAYLIVATTPDIYLGSEALPYAVHVSLGEVAAPEQDTQAPDLISLTIPAAIGLGNGSATTQISAVVTDDVSGPGNVVVYFDNKISYASEDGLQPANSYDFFGIFGSEQTWSDGQATARFDVSDTSEREALTVTQVHVSDAAGNLQIYDTAELEDLGVNTRIDFTNNIAPTGLPTLTGLARDGGVLSIDTTTIMDDDGIGPLSYAWLRDGLVIGGETDGTYAVGEADRGAQIEARVSYVDGLGTAESLLSAPSEPISGVIAGGPGIDTAAFTGDQRTYTLTLSPTELSLRDRSADQPGADILTDLEFLDFDIDLLDGPFDLQAFGGAATLDADALKGFVELYIAYFNRAPDAVGLHFWGTAFANGLSLEEMAALFIDQDETRLTYPEGSSNEDFARAVYDNALGRVPDDAGIAFWVGVLNSGAVAQDQFILEVLRGAMVTPQPGADEAFIDQQLADRAYLSNKTDIGAHFAVNRGMSDVDNATAAMDLFTGTQASIDAAIARIDADYAAAQDISGGEFLMPMVGVLPDPFASV